MTDRPPDLQVTDNRLDESLVKWIPLVVPLFALFITLAAFLIEAAVA
jgi:hypothetical protein